MTIQPTRYGISNMTLPPEGPQVILVPSDLTNGATEFDIDLSSFVERQQISFVQGIFVDNVSGGAQDLFLQTQPGDTGQRIYIPAGKQVYSPVFCVNPQFKLTAAVSPGLVIPVYFHNMPLMPAMIG